MNSAEITTKTTIAKRSLNSAICCHLDLIELNLFRRQENRAKDLAKEKVASFTGLFSPLNSASIFVPVLMGVDLILTGLLLFSQNKLHFR